MYLRPEAQFDLKGLANADRILPNVRESRPIVWMHSRQPCLKPAINMSVSSRFPPPGIEVVEAAVGERREHDARHGISARPKRIIFVGCKFLFSPLR
jgi:hypothetical protein